MYGIALVEYAFATFSSYHVATSKKLITREEWEKKLNDVKIRKEDMNRLVMNFLVTEGYVDAAEKFRMESGTEPDIDLATITDRMAVKKAVQSGNVEDAIEKVNDLNPEVVETAEELERTVALLAFEDVSNCPVGELLDISQRLKTASEVNAAILTSQSHEKDPKLPSLLKMLIWAQNQLDEKAAYPRINDLSTATLEDPTIRSRSAGARTTFIELRPCRKKVVMGKDFLLVSRDGIRDFGAVKKFHFFHVPSLSAVEVRVKVMDHPSPVEHIELPVTQVTELKG
ncbi:hypothetical protein C3L33_15476, partial [Rhododendron williamsianum]